MSTPPRLPPRFVPTLTDVVHLPEGAQSPAPRDVGEAAPQGDPAPTVPVVPVVASPDRGWPDGTLPDGIEEYVVHRLMQRVDLVLDQQLREAIAAVVQEQTRSIVVRLREEVESVVRHAVYEAVAQELSGERARDSSR